ncbi:MAG TPA: sugar phosphate isomerase/epimerase family protein [Thermomicrobiales bacterium]|nr:sugar phosphate isomerase/epimerase family protein [Thermomicrobiales bacterium]
MWTLTGFADEISPELDEQLATLAAEQMRYLEFRSAWGTNILDLTDDELARASSMLHDAGVRVSSIGSPIGKIGITDDFAPHLDRFDRALEVAKRLDAPYIRIFSFFIPEGGDPASYRDEVLDRLRQIVDRASGHDVTLLHENEKEIYGDVPERCLDILASIGSPQLRAAWDPANFVQCGVQPHTSGYDLLRPYIGYVHIKDAKLAEGQVVPAGEGDGQVRETVRALRDSGFDGFFSLEPHLAVAGTFSGFSGPELFRLAVQRFKALLHEESIAWA